MKREIHLMGICLTMLLTGCASSRIIVLHQTHTFESIGKVDTLVTYISKDHVRVSYAAGDAILDFPGNRMLLLDPETKSYRQIALSEWEANLREAVEISSKRNPGPQPGFEPTGQSVEISGYVCDRYTLFTRREMLPGEVDYVEQQIWVARDFKIPQSTYAAYARAMGSIDSIGLGGFAKRPAGVVLQMEMRSHSEKQPRAAAEVERNRVTRIERIKNDRSLFEIPSAFRRANSPSDQP